MFQLDTGVVYQGIDTHRAMVVYKRNLVVNRDFTPWKPQKF